MDLREENAFLKKSPRAYSVYCILCQIVLGLLITIAGVTHITESSLKKRTILFIVSECTFVFSFIVIIILPVAFAIPRFNAVPFPPFSLWKTLTFSLSSFFAISKVLSLLPSSTTITSKSGYPDFNTDFIVFAIVSSSLYAGIITVTLTLESSASVYRGFFFFSPARKLI